MSDALPAELRELHDKLRITELLYTYCRAVDRIDPELGYTIWHDDAEVDYGPAIYRGSGRGVIDYICASHRSGIVHSHQITNVLIALAADVARSEAYVTSKAIVPTPAGERMMLTRGRYLDRWARRDGRWGIVRRTFACDINESRAVAHASIPPSFALDRTDPSYALFDGHD